MCDNGEESGDEAVVVNQLSAEMCISDEIMYITWKSLCGINWESYNHAHMCIHACMLVYSATRCHKITSLCLCMVYMFACKFV